MILPDIICQGTSPGGPPAELATACLFCCGTVHPQHMLCMDPWPQNHVVSAVVM